MGEKTHIFHLGLANQFCQFLKLKPEQLRIALAENCFQLSAEAMELVDFLAANSKHLKTILVLQDRHLFHHKGKGINILKLW